MSLKLKEAKENAHPKVQFFGRSYDNTQGGKHFVTTAFIPI